MVEEAELIRARLEAVEAVEAAVLPESALFDPYRRIFSSFARVIHLKVYKRHIYFNECNKSDKDAAF